MTYYESYKVIKGHYVILLSSKVVLYLVCRKSTHTAQTPWCYLRCHINLNKPIAFQIKFAQLMYCLSPLIFHAQYPLPSIKPPFSKKFEIPHSLCKLFIPSTQSPYNTHTLCIPCSSIFRCANIKGLYPVSKKYPVPITYDLKLDYCIFE